MCGICGEVNFGARPADVSAVRRMMNIMVPRGPDADGMFAYGSVAFGHRRLKIIDLSDHARQPMVDPELGLAIAFNGAIYNYPELRSELQQLGYRFFSTGDTEVILKAYHAWGKDCLQRLNGMFSFAISERDSGRVFLARDRLGIKPLYYVDTQGGFRFASSLPALLAAGGVSGALDPVAIHHYFSFHAVVPAPHTLLRDVRKLPPATFMVINPDGTRHSETYFKVEYGPRPEEQSYTFQDWKAGTLEVMRRSALRRLVADVPVGVLLSGGLDSSLVVGLLAEAGHSHIETFSIGFETVNNERGDEFQYSDVIARHFNTKHHKISVDSQKALPALERCVQAMSEPMVSHDNIGFYLLGEAVTQHVKVVQSGQGADEIFAGYHWYPPLLTSQDGLADYKRYFFDRDHAEMRELLEPQWFGEDHSTRFVKEHFAQPGATEAIDRALRLDSTVMLVDDPVKRVDNMTMAWGLEARVPFLDHEVVEFAARVPGRFKVPEGGKYVLKEAAREIIPAAVIDRPKGYFPVPALKYLQGPYLARVKALFDNRAAKERGLVQKSYLNKLLDSPESHLTPLRGSKLWQVALLEWWLQTHLGSAS